MSKVEIVVRNTCTTVGEGPHWEERTQSLLYVNMFRGHIHRYTPETNTDEILDLGVDTVNAIIPCKTGGYLVNNHSAIRHLNWGTSKLTTIAEIEHQFDHVLNDAKCDAKGRYWTGTMPMLYPPDKQPNPPFPEGSCGLYSLDINGTVKKHLDNVMMSNGIAWSLDNRIMYYVDSGSGKLVAFDYDLETGSISKEVESVIIPGQMDTTSCCFGGKDYSDLYVTSSIWNPHQTEDKMYEPTAGSMFKVTGAGAKGFPAYECGLSMPISQL